MRTPIITSIACATVVLVLAFFFLDDEVALLQDSTLETATITGCDYKISKQTRQSRRRNSARYASIAITPSGEKIRGAYIHPSRSSCEKRLYRDTGVFVSGLDNRLSRINSFYDFWLAPFIFTTLFLVFVMSALRASAIGTQIGYAIHIVAAVIPAVLLATYWMDYETKPISTALGSGSNTSAENNFSNELLDRCIKNTLIEGDYANEQEIQKLICQEMKISDLSRLKGLTGLERLYLQSNKLDNLNTLPNLPNLKVMSIAANKMTSLSGITNAPNLEELQSNSNKVARIDELRALNNLQTVAFMFNKISNLSPLATLQDLKSVNFNYNDISDISALANKPKLASVHMFSNKITDISPLFDSSGLEELGIVGKANTIRCEQVEQLLSQVSFKIHDSWRSRCH